MKWVCDVRQGLQVARPDQSIRPRLTERSLVSRMETKNKLQLLYTHFVIQEPMSWLTEVFWEFPVCFNKWFQEFFKVQKYHVTCLS